ncbi:MAG: PEP-CTERM sorting domain-containing protein [Armatimonadetes bacterium]|nr:PEP-CTERM sorting domain-containing protein [Armatimonadota bacterium]
MRQKVGTVILAGLCGVAHASFDLMLLASKTAESGTGFYKVHRIDPANGYYFGSFSVGPEVVGMAANAAKGELYTIDPNGFVRVFNYSTGERKSIFATGLTLGSDLSMSLDGTKMYAVNGTNSIYSISLTTPGAATIVATKAGRVYSKLTTTQSGNMFVADDSALFVDRFSSSGSNFIYSTSSSINPSMGPVGQMTINNSGIGIPPTLLYSAGINVGYHQLTAPDTFSGAGTILAVNGFTEFRATARSHDGTYIIGNDNGSAGTRVTALDATGFISSTFTYSGINGNVGRVAIVLAPEPASLAVLGLALGALAMRRRRL